LAALLPAGPYVKSTGRLTVKPSALRVLEYRSAAAAGGGPALFAVWKVYDRSPAERVWWGVGGLAFAGARGSRSVGGLASRRGLGLYRRRAARTPGAWVMLLACLGVAYGLWRVVVVVGYLSDRHTLLILLCGSFWAVAGLLWLAERLPGLAPR